ncbi:MAG: YihY/virulence factor BrkB family protein [Ilumatobacteraceae bacterium]
MARRTEQQGGGGDALGSAAAVALLATAALEARRLSAGGERQQRPEEVDVEVFAADSDVAAVGSQRGLKGTIDAFQAGRPYLAFPVGVIRKFGDDRSGRLAAVISYYSFFSLFPALLALTTILGFVLEGNKDLADDIRNSALAQFPVIGSELGTSGTLLTGSTFALVVGIAGAIWAGMGAAQASQDAMNTIWNVPRPEQPGFAPKRLRSLAVLVVIALLFAANAVLPDLTGARTAGPVSVIVLPIASVIVDAVIFAFVFRLLTARPLSWRDVWIGAVVAAAGYVLLQNVGTLYINHVLKGAANVYGTFATVIGLLTWMFLLGQWVILAATINVVRTLRLWPRSLFRPPLTRADRRSQRGKLDEAKLTEHVEVDVEFTPPAPSAAG